MMRWEQNKYLYLIWFTNNGFIYSYILYSSRWWFYIFNAVVRLLSINIQKFKSKDVKPWSKLLEQVRCTRNRHMNWVL